MALCLWAVERHLDGRRARRVPARLRRGAAAARGVAVLRALRPVAGVARAAPPRAGRCGCFAADRRAVVRPRVDRLGQPRCAPPSAPATRTPTRPPSPPCRSSRSSCAPHRARGARCSPARSWRWCWHGARASRPESRVALAFGAAAVAPDDRRRRDDPGRLRRQPALRRAAGGAGVRAGRRSGGWASSAAAVSALGRRAAPRATVAAIAVAWRVVPLSLGHVRRPRDSSRRRAPGGRLLRRSCRR